MKKITLLIFTLILLFCLCACSCEKKSNSLTLNVSGLRLDVYYGETENYALTVFPETRETPLLFDGKIGETENATIIKLRIKGKDNGSYSVNFSTDKQYVANFSFNAVTDCYTTTLIVEKLPDKPFNAIITHNDKSENISLVSIKNKDTITADNALEKAYIHKKEYVDSLTFKNAFNGEIIIKLICERDKSYWYVGFVTEEKTLAVLIEGKSGKVLAEKTLLN